MRGSAATAAVLLAATTPAVSGTYRIYCLAHDSVAWSTCTGIMHAPVVMWDPIEAVPMNDPAGADAALTKGPLSAIKFATDQCRIAARQYVCAAAWRDCIYSIEDVHASPDEYAFHDTHLQGVAVDVVVTKETALRRVPLSICEQYTTACTADERQTARDKFFRLLHIFRAITHRTDEESAILADFFLNPDCSNTTYYGEREMFEGTCKLTGRPMPEPPMKGLAVEAPPGTGFCADVVDGDTCCAAEQQAAFEPRLRALLRGYGTSKVVTEGACAVHMKKLLCAAGCGYAESDAARLVDGGATLELQVGYNMCEQMRRDCSCELSGLTGRPFETDTPTAEAMCDHVATALLPLAQEGNPEVTELRVKVVPLTEATSTVLPEVELKQACERMQVLPSPSGGGGSPGAATPHGEWCNTHGKPHAPRDVPGDGGQCAPFLPPGGETCCSDAHSADLNENLKLMAGILKNPTCGHEFAKLACTTLCSPAQHLFASTTSWPETNADGSLNVTVRVSEDWCEDIVSACKDEVDPRDKQRFADKFGTDSKLMCSLIGPYLNVMLAPGKETPRYHFEPHPAGHAVTPGDVLLSEQVCTDVRTCETPEEVCPLAPGVRTPVPWTAHADAYGPGSEARPAAPSAVPAAEAAHACGAYADAACCTPEEADAVSAWPSAKSQSGLGAALAATGAACAGNVSALFCGLACDPAQRHYVDGAPGKAVSMYVLGDYCGRVFDACGGAGAPALRDRGITDPKGICDAVGAIYSEVAPEREGGAVRVSVGTGRARGAQWGWELVPRRQAELGVSCPLSDDEPKHPIAGKGLELCTQHNDEACCYPAPEHELAARLQLLKRQFGGAQSECLPAVLALTCATACSPKQSYFIKVQRTPEGEPLPLPDGSLNATNYVTPEYCSHLYGLCKDAFSEIFGKRLGDLYETPTEFCESFSVTSDPTYKPGPGKATLITRVGINPDTGLGIGSPAMPGGGDPEPLPDVRAALDAAPTAACLREEAKPRPLGFCTQYQDMSCCDVELEKTIGGNLTAVASHVFGKGCCFERLSQLVCGLACSPRQADYMSNVTANEDGSFNVTIFVSQPMADALWHDCAPHKMLATTTVETYFEGPEDLLARIASGVQTEEVKQLTIRVGTHPFSHIGVGEADAQLPCTDPPPLSELDIGLEELPTDPLKPPGMVPMYLLLFAAILLSALLGVLYCCAPRATEAVSAAASADGSAHNGGGSATAQANADGTAPVGTNGHAGNSNGNSNGQSSGREPKAPSANEGVATALYERVEEGYAALGRFFASSPTFALVPLAVILTWSFTQLPHLKMETQPSELWVAQGTPSVWQYNYVGGRFGGQRHQVMIITTKVPGGDVLFPEALAEAAAVEAELRKSRFFKDGANATLEEVCSRVQCHGENSNLTSICLFQSPLSYWEGDAYRSDADLYGTVSNLAAKDKCGIPILRKTVLGGLETDGHGRVTKATSLMVAILLQAQPLDKARAWEYGFLDVCREANLRTRHVQVSYLAQISQDEEVARLAAADVPLLVMSYVMMIAYVVFAMAGPDRTRSHVLLGLTGVALVICSIIIMLGLTVLLKVPFTPVSTQVLPFLLLGIGVDNIFILSNTYMARLHLPRTGALSPPELVGSILAQVGPTITLTSTATTLAFAVGSLSVMPAVKYFCQQCVLGFVVNLALQLSVFSIAIAADLGRVRARRVDCLPWLTPCFGIRRPSVGSGPQLIHHDAPRSDQTHPQPNVHLNAQLSVGGAHAGDSAVDSGLSDWMAGAYVTWLSRPSVQAGVVLAFGAAFAGGLHHALQVGQGLEIGEVLPKGSYMSVFFERFEFYSDIGPPVYLVATNIGVDPDDNRAPTELVDFTDHATQDVLGELVAALELSPWIKPPALDWLGDFQKWSLVVSNHTQEVIDAEGRIPPDRFYPWLHEFLAPGSDFAFYSNYLNFNNEGFLESARVMGFHIPLQSTDTFVQAMLDMRALVEPFALKANVTVFPYSEYHVFYEQYAILVPQASKLLFSAIVVILLVMSLLLGNMLLSLPVLLLLTLNQIDLIGVMHLSTVHMNGISIINLVMAIGLSVEYLAHIASTYNTATGNHVAKLRQAMASVGSSVVSGACTTLLGVVVLAFAKYPVFQVYYFRMYLATVLCGSLHGLVLLPVVLGIMQAVRGDGERNNTRPSSPSSATGTGTVTAPGAPAPDSEGANRRAQRNADPAYTELF